MTSTGGRRHDTLAIPRVAGVATAVPAHALRQDEVAELGRRVFAGRTAEFERLRPAYVNAGIETRHSCVAIGWYEKRAGWRERNRLYLDHAVPLLQRAAEAALAKAGLQPEAIDGIVLVSTSGIATPSLDALLMERMPFRRNVQRLPIFGLGCAGGVLGLARTAALARAAPAERWLFLVVELCGLTFRNVDRSKSNIIATALFGDGAAAAVVSCDGDGLAMSVWGEHTWPDSLDVMGWRIEEDGFGVLFSRDIPNLIRKDLRPTVERFLGSHGLTLHAIDHFILHPGGAKVLDALEDAFDLARGDLGHARAVLRDYGNMSAATVMFVLERAIAKGAAGRMLLSALGPGFTAGFLLMESRS